MPLLDQIRETKLIELAKTRFDPDLTEAELKVLHDSASSEELPDPGEKVPRPVVRADFLRWLATDPEAAPHIDPKGLRVYAATIPGQLNLENCHVPVPLDFRRCTMKGEINLRFAETRAIFLLDSSFNGGIRAAGIDVQGPLYLQRSDFSGEISLLRAKINGVLACSGSKLKTKGHALSADSAQIGSSVFLTEGFESEGEIRLLRAKIKGDLDCVSAKLRVKKGIALNADSAEIGGYVFLSKGFESDGTILLLGAQIGRDLEFQGAKVAEVVCQNTVVTGDLFWQRIEKSEKTFLNLIGARVKNLRDDRISWPDEGNLILDGLVYEELTLHETKSIENIKARRLGCELPLVVKERIAWIMLQKPERRTEPQSWMQLAKHLEAKGDRKDAKHVIYKFRCLRAHAQKKMWFFRRWAIFFAWLEESPARILLSITATLLLGWLIFGFAGAKGAIAPSEPEAYKAFITEKPMPAAYPTLNPFVYTLENAVPLVKLGQDEKWAPDRRYPGTNCFTNYWFLMWSRWLLILSGWVQATVLAAALSGRFKP
jgi:hypothetical protein